MTMPSLEELASSRRKISKQRPMKKNTPCFLHSIGSCPFSAAECRYSHGEGELLDNNPSSAGSPLSSLSTETQVCDGNAAENAVYNICKNFRPLNKNMKYLITDNRNQIIKNCDNLEKLLKDIDWKKM